MSIYYEQSGQGPHLVLVHGWGLHGGVWTDVARELVAHYRVTVLDLPGHGRSRDVLPGGFSPEILAQEIQRLFTGPAIWVGWSLGALVALAAAQHYPAAVEKLVLVGATPKFVAASDWPHGMAPAVLRQFALDLERDYAGTLTRFLSLQIAADQDRATLRRMRSELFRYGAPATAALRAGLQLLEQQDRRGSLADIATPTLIVHGARDKLVPLAAAEFLAEHLPTARLEIIALAGHAPFLSQPSAFTQTLEEFIHA